MPRAPRLEYSNALYHVINRGNYRQDVFEEDSTRYAFEKCLFEACEMSDWLLHGYSIMRNHFHIALRTPRANLVKGMHWLESTFATRFNRYRREQGHLFQGRYTAILVQPGFSLARVVNYIHLNPVKAKLLPAAQLGEFRWSSFHRFQQRNRPKFMQCADWMFELGGLQDSKEGWRRYHDYLIWLATMDAEQKRQAFETICRGWAIGDDEWRKQVSRDHKQLMKEGALRGGGEAAELKELAWERALHKLLGSSGKSRDDVRGGKKSAAWKIDLAETLRRTTTATNGWIARQLRMGTSESVSVYLSRRRGNRRKIKELGHDPFQVDLSGGL